MSSERKLSIFAQKMQKLRDLKERNQIFQPATSSSQSAVFGDRSFIVEGTEAKEIHDENVAKLTAMSEEQLLEMRKNVLETFNFSNIEFLKKRRKLESNTDLESSFTNLTTNEFTPDVAEELKHKGLHMDNVEKDKMKWMEEVPKISAPLPNSLYNARFDFEGDLLPFVEENTSTCDKGLYHHGEEPQRPGYTIEELYQLSRSSMSRQRILALNTLAAVLEKEFVLSSCLETELLKVLLESGVFIILRFSLDERLKPVYLASLRGLGALFWRPLDMHYLSDMVGVFGDLRLPSFEVENEALHSENADEMKDVEIMKLDLVRGALRTDLVQRFRYLIEDPLFEIDHFLHVIKCLTRLCYHSAETATVVLNTPLLLEILFANCHLPTQSDKLYTAKLMILFRVIACRSSVFAESLQTRLNLVSFLLDTIGDTVTKTSTSSQCIYLWHVFLHRGIQLESINGFTPMFYTLLNQLFAIRAGELTTGLIVYATALITLLTFLIERFFDLVQFLIPVLEQLGCLWISVIANERHPPREFVKLASNTIYLLTLVPADRVPSFHAKIQSFLKTSAYDRHSLDLKSCSFLLNANKRSFVDSLPSLCVPAGILTSTNSLLLVHGLVKYSLQHGDRDFARDLLNQHVWTYVTTILQHGQLAEMANIWCSRYEIAFLCDIVKACSKWEVYIERRLLQLAFALVRIVHTDDASAIENIFQTVIFNPGVYDKIIMGQPDVSDVLADLESMEQFFLAELNLPKKDASLMSTPKGTECILPTDWFYVPILKISNAKSAYVNVNADTMRPLLRWVRLIENLADEIETHMTLAARYCRVCCVFFCSDVFLAVADLLRDILVEIVKRNHKLEFKTAIPGISSFYDFYRDLCEQFISSSYCNPVFAAYVLVPLQQKHDVELRKYVWTEQTIMLRFLTLSADQLPIPISCYLEPNETNLQLIEMYLMTIATGKIKEKMCPIMYRIGVHHVVSFVNKFSEELMAKKFKQKIETIGNEGIRNEFLNYVYEPSS